MRILWPQIVLQASDLGRAKIAFMIHALNDQAWINGYGEHLWKKINSFTEKSGEGEA
jgi:hypothetical protein